jgi:hypothetical protein
VKSKVFRALIPFLLLTAVCPLSAHSANAVFERLPKEITYSEVRADSAKAQELKQEAARKIISAGLHAESGFERFLGVDFAAVSADGRKFLMMIQGVEVRAAYRNRLYSVGSMFVYHTSIRGQPVALGFRNLNTQEIDRILQLLAASTVAVYPTSWKFELLALLISLDAANADQIATGAPSDPPAPKEDKWGECAYQVREGGWDSFRVPLETLYTLDDALTDRLKANAGHLLQAGPRQYWRDNVEDFWRRVSEAPEMWKAFKAPLQAATTAGFLEKVKKSWPQLSSLQPGLQAFCRGTAQFAGQLEMVVIPIYAPRMMASASTLKPVNKMSYYGRGAITSYGDSNEFVAANLALRTGQWPEYMPSRVAEIKQFIDDLKKALSALPEYQGVVYRSARIKDPAILKLLRTKDAVYTDKGFLSSSRSSAVAAKNFPSSGDQGVFMVIRSRSGRSIEGLLQNDEQEVLFSPNSQFRVTSTTPRPDGSIVVYLDEF